MDEITRQTATKPGIPDEMIVKWQRIIDLLGRTVGAPSGLIMKVVSPQIEVFLASKTNGNPYKKGERADLDTGLYCAQVIAQRAPLLVPDALTDPTWDHNPDIALGMTYYLGFPLTWPDGEIFGTICLLDAKNNHQASAYKELVSEFQQLIERDLRIIAETADREKLIAELHQYRNNLQELVYHSTIELQKRSEQLEENLRFETLISEISARFVNLAPEKIDDEITSALDLIRKFFQVDRFMLGRVSEDQSTVHYLHASTAHGIGPITSVDLRTLFPWAHTHLIVQGKPLSTSSVDDLPEEAVIDRQNYIEQGLYSTLSVPVIDERSAGYCVTATSDRRQYQWPLDYIPRLRLVGEIFVNILNRGMSELRLKQTESEYRTLADTTYDWVYWQNPEGTMRYVSPSCERITGYTAREFQEDPSLLERIILPEDRHIWDSHHQEQSEEISRSIQFRIRKKNSVVVWIDHACTRVYNTEGTCLGHRVSNRDITPRKQVEQELKNSRTRLLQAQRIAHIGNWEWSSAENSLFLSEEVHRIFGFEPKATRVSYAAFLDRVHPDDREAVKQAVNESLTDPAQGFSIDYRIIRPDGSERVVHSQGEIALDHLGKAVRMNGTTQDITERKNAEVIGELSRAFYEIANEDTDPGEKQNRFVRVIQQYTGCRAVGIRLLGNDRYIPYTACTGFSEEFYEMESPLSLDIDRCMCIRVIRGDTDASLPFFTENGSFYMNATTRFLATVSEEDKGETRNVCNAMGYESVALVPIKLNDRIDGLIHLADTRENMVPIDKIRILENVSVPLGLTIRRALADLKLNKSEKNLSEAQRIAHLGSWELNIVTNELMWSDEVYRIFGLEPQKFAATYDAFLDSVHPDDRTAVMEAVNRSLADPDHTYDIHHRVLRPDGTERIVHERAEVFFSQDGTPLRLIGTVQDITEQKRMEKRLEDQLAEINNLKQKLEAENIYLRKEINLLYTHDEIVGQSEAIRTVLKQVEQVAPTSSAVLILGETGTGKELVARAIHRLSKRKDRVMVVVNCASLPSALVESELFGREKGAYTGALTKQAGRFEIANGSTIMLDEIGELSLELQAKLLRVLQDGCFERLGSPKTVKVDVRVIAATNRDLAEEVKKGRFREDLYYRLNVFPIRVPPLRDRAEDIPLLTWAFINEFSEQMGKKFSTVPKRTMESLKGYSWPGNIRQLRNVIEQAFIISDGTLHVRLPREADNESLEITTLEEAEISYITSVLERTGWRIKGRNGAAELLGLRPSTLYTKMKKLGIPNRSEKDDMES